MGDICGYFERAPMSAFGCKADMTFCTAHVCLRTIPFLLQWDETFDIGSDTGTGVDDRDYQVPFAFTGKIVKLNIKIDRPQLSAADIKLLETTSQRNNRSSE